MNGAPRRKSAVPRHGLPVPANIRDAYLAWVRTVLPAAAVPLAAIAVQQSILASGAGEGVTPPAGLRTMLLAFAAGAVVFGRAFRLRPLSAPPGRSFAEAVREARSASWTLVGFAFAPVVLGVLIVLVSRSVLDQYLTLVLTLAGFAMLFPRQEAWAGWIRHLTGGPSAGEGDDAGLAAAGGPSAAADPPAAASDDFTPAAVRHLVTEPLWVRFEGGGETDSTNDDCTALARAGAPEGTVVLATRQRAGKGRLGRTWASPEGGAYLSVLLRPHLDSTAVAPLGLVVALGTAEGLDALGVRADLKWPNDVLLDGGKLAGVLLEASSGATSVAWVVAGIGINVARPDRTPQGWAHLAERVSASRGEVVAAVLDGVARAYGEFARHGFAPLAPRFAARHAIDGRQVTVRDASGMVVAEGRVAGIDTSGRLLVEVAGRTDAVAAGEVTLRG